MTLQIISQWPQAWASQVSIEFLSTMEKVMLDFALAPRFPVHSSMFLLWLGPGVPGEVHLGFCSCAYFHPMTFRDPRES